MDNLISNVPCRDYMRRDIKFPLHLQQHAYESSITFDHYPYRVNTSTTSTTQFHLQMIDNTSFYAIYPISHLSHLSFVSPHSYSMCIFQSNSSLYCCCDGGMYVLSPVSLQLATCDCQIPISCTWIPITPILLLMFLILPLWFLYGRDEMDILLFTEN